MDHLQNAAFITIFIASLIGSPHCAGMCGGFVAIYTHNSKDNFRSHILYSLGRVSTYLLLGTIGAYAGESINSKVTSGNFTALIIGIILVLNGCIQLFGFSNTLTKKLTEKTSKLVQYAAKPVFNSKNNLKPFLIGFATTFLPCGWLYTFVALAIASASPLKGAFIMLAFWLGTLPVMLSVGFTAKVLTGKLGRVLPRLSAVLVIIAGIFSIYSHLSHAHHDHSHHNHGGHMHHEN